MRIRSVYSVVICVLLTSVLSGCGTYRERAEQVFLRQNMASSALMHAIMDAEAADPVLADTLYGSEAELQGACGPLQEAAARSLYGGRADTMLKLEAWDTLESCARKTDEIMDLLWQVDPEAIRELAATAPDGSQT